MKQAPKIILGIVVLALVVWGVVAYNSEPAREGTVKIGAVLPLTGWGAYWGEPEQAGAQLAVRDIRAAGGDVELFIEDGATEARTSASAAQKLITVNGVEGMFTSFTGPSSAVSPIARENEVPLLFVSATKSILEQNPYALKTYFNIEKQCYEGARHFVAEGSLHLGGFLMTLDFASECQQGIERAVEGTSVVTSYYEFPVDTTDFRTDIAKAREADVDAVISIFYEENAVAFFRQRAELNWITPIVTGLGVTDNFPESARENVRPETLEGVITYDQLISNWFAERMREEYPDMSPDQYLAAAYGYDETMYLYEALQECPRGDAECVIEEIRKGSSENRALISEGFGGDRNIILNPAYLRYTDGQLVPVELNQ